MAESALGLLGSGEALLLALSQAGDRSKILAATALTLASALAFSWRACAYGLHYFELFLCFLQGQSKRRAENGYLKGSFEPIHSEIHERALAVEGTLPEALTGVFARIGPNPALQPKGDYHWFDGDGMLHACTIAGQQVTYCNRFVQTTKLQRERQLGFPIYSKFGDMRGKLGILHALLGQFKLKIGVTPRGRGTGAANTALTFHANRLLAMHEGDMPYAMRVLCDGLIETVGRVQKGDYAQHPITAHPKRDPATGELFYIGYLLDINPPGLWLGSFSAAGERQSEVFVPMDVPTMTHDFAITPSHAVLIDAPLVFNPKVMFERNTLPLTFDRTRKLRFGFLPRKPKDGSEVVWCEVEGPPLMIFHTAACWEEGDKVVLFACAFRDFTMDSEEAANVGDHGLARFYKFVIDPATRAASSQLFADVPCDFPQIPTRHIGHKLRYAYAAVMLEGSLLPIFTGVVKIDLQAADPSKSIVGRITHGPRRFGGECSFVEKAPAGGAPGAEDEGYLVTYVSDEATGQSEMVVYDARTMAAAPLARVTLPQRVPHGFHAIHVKAEDMQRQGLPTGLALP